MTVRLTLISHAATIATRDVSFPADEPLDAEGVAAIAALRSRFTPGERCWTSPAARAGATAEGLGLMSEVEPALRDCDYGRWCGRAFETVGREEPEGLAAWLSDPAASPHGGEPLQAVMLRVAEWMDDRAATSGSILAVAHASTIRAAVVHALGAPPAAFWRIDVPPLTAAKLSGLKGRWTLGSIGSV